LAVGLLDSLGVCLACKRKPLAVPKLDVHKPLLAAMAGSQRTGKILLSYRLMTDTERKVIEILTQHEVTPDAWAAPIQAVDRAMGWASVDTREFVTGLLNRRLVAWVPIVVMGSVYDARTHWKKGSAYPGVDV
jgi:hypothetical protein